MIKLYYNKKEIKYTKTVFPDGTSQVWKLEELPPEDLKQYIRILWMFEYESELIELLQLCFLLKNKYNIEPKLDLPFCPYARQDKELDNNTTWVKSFFVDLLKSYFTNSIKVKSYDLHSTTEDIIWSRSPSSFHNSILPDNAIIIFPDKGATIRYNHLNDRQRTYFEKIRNQQTGVIEGMSLASDGFLLEGNDLYIVDDICDGGATFIACAAELKKYNPKSINLVVSHGLFTKGTKCLYDAGITKIFTTNSLLRNNKKSKENFEVYNILDSYVELPYNDGYERKMV